MVRAGLIASHLDYGRLMFVCSKGSRALEELARRSAERMSSVLPPLGGKFGPCVAGTACWGAEAGMGRIRL